MIHNRNSIMLLMLLMGSAMSSISYGQYSVKLKGVVDSFYTSEYRTSELIIRKVITANIIGKEEWIKVPFGKDGSFQVELPLEDSLGYFAFGFEDKGTGNKAGLIKNTYGGHSQPPLKEVYLFQAGDSIVVNIRPTVRPFFWGKGSEKLNCASKMYDIETIHKGLDLTSQHLQQSENERFELRQDALKYCIGMRMRLLQAYKKALSPTVYELLRADAVYSGIYPYAGVISSANTSLEIGSYSKEAIGYVYRNTQQHLPADIDPSVIARSAYGADLLFRNEMIKRLLEQPDLKNDRKAFAALTYQYFKNNYTGDLRDKLLLVFFETLGRHYSSEVKDLATDALSIAGSNRYARKLKNWKETQYYAYPFRLYDAKQKLHTLADYKGKLVIMDFYFSKCGPCIALAGTLKPIIHQYKDRKDIVFITVNTDQRDVFLKTLATKVFTSEETVNLYTNGKGMGDPLIMQYDFKGFPRMLIIGKDGSLISSSPPRPDISEENKKAFLQLITSSL